MVRNNTYGSTHQYDEQYFANQVRKSDRKVAWQYGNIFALAGANPVGRVLDVGCGAGPGLRYLSARGVEAFGVDVMRYPLNEAQRMNSNFGLVQANVEYVLPFADASFDVLLVSELIEHLRNGRHLLFDSYRILRPGGRIIVTTPNLWDVRRVVAKVTKQPWSGETDPTHVNLYSPTRLVDEMTSAGFTHVHWRTGVKPVFWISSRKLDIQMPVPYPPAIGNGLLATGIRAK